MDSLSRPEFANLSRDQPRRRSWPLKLRIERGCPVLGRVDGPEDDEEPGRDREVHGEARD